MTHTPLAGHVRRYPIWYSTLATWVGVMLLLPAIGIDAAAAVLRPDPGPSAVATMPPPPETSPRVGAPMGPGAPTPRPTSTTTSATSLPDAAPLEPAANGPFDELVDLIFDLIPPPLAIPDLPPELRELVGAFGPITTYGCGQLGLVSSLLGIAQLLQVPGTEGLPVARLLAQLGPYLIPVTTACSHFEVPDEHSECGELDAALVASGAIPLLGVAVDQLEAFENLLVHTYRAPTPALAKSLREQLGCKRVT